MNNKGKERFQGQAQAGEFYVFVVSDSTGETAEKVARAAISQFSIPDVHLKRFLLIDSELKLREIITEAADKNN